MTLEVKIQIYNKNASILKSYCLMARKKKGL